MSLCDISALSVDIAEPWTSNPPLEKSTNIQMQASDKSSELDYGSMRVDGGGS